MTWPPGVVTVSDAGHKSFKPQLAFAIVKTLVNSYPSWECAYRFNRYRVLINGQSSSPKNVAICTNYIPHTLFDSWPNNTPTNGPFWAPLCLTPDKSKIRKPRSSMRERVKNWNRRLPLVNKARKDLMDLGNHALL